MNAGASPDAPRRQTKEPAYVVREVLSDDDKKIRESESRLAGMLCKCGGNRSPGETIDGHNFYDCDKCELMFELVRKS
jgi:hypothetical protein